MANHDWALTVACICWILNDRSCFHTCMVTTHVKVVEWGSCPGFTEAHWGTGAVWYNAAVARKLQNVLLRLLKRYNDIKWENTCECMWHKSQMISYIFFRPCTLNEFLYNSFFYIKRYMFTVLLLVWILLMDEETEA